MSSLPEVYKWMADHLEDKRDLTPLPPTHPRPGYVYDADERERKAWLSYVQVIDEELDEHGSRNPDYVRLREAKEIWQKAADAQTAARIKWEKVRYL